VPIPLKFKSLIESAEITAPIPDYVWMAFAVCVTDENACGWSGWIIEAVKRKAPRKNGKSQSTHRDEVLTAADNQKCPRCGKQTSRTGVEKKFNIDKKTPPKIEYEYEILPIEYE
jgi:hypothetical protein